VIEKNLGFMKGYLKNIMDEEYRVFGFHIENNKIYPFSAEYFADTLCNEILGRD